MSTPFTPEQMLIPSDVYWDIRWNEFSLHDCTCGTCGGEGPCTRLYMRCTGQRKPDEADLCRKCWGKVMETVYG